MDESTRALDDPALRDRRMDTLTGWGIAVSALALAGWVTSAEVAYYTWDGESSVALTMSITPAATATLTAVLMFLASANRRFVRRDLDYRTRLLFARLDTLSAVRATVHMPNGKHNGEAKVGDMMQAYIAGKLDRGYNE